jgi:hypothetical protein
MICRVDPFKNQTWGFEIGFFEHDTYKARKLLGVYRPAFKDYLIFKTTKEIELNDVNNIESLLNIWATTETEDLYFTLMDQSIDLLNYSSFLKKTPMWINTNDSQYNLLGTIMLVNNKLLLGGCCTLEFGDRTPWTLGPINDFDNVLKFHEFLVEQGVFIMQDLIPAKTYFS